MNKSFRDGIQFAWDSTSLGALKTCPFKYYLSIVEGWTSRAQKIDLVFGIAYHSALEQYDRERARGVSHEDATLEAVRKALILSSNWTETTQYKNRLTLIRTVVWYLEENKESPFQTIILSDGTPAVELSFRFDIGDGYLLCGHIDRLVEFDENPWVHDRKTTKTTLSPRYFEQWTPENQMSLYSLAGHVILETPIQGVVIDAAQIAVNFSRFARGFAPRNKPQLDEWLEDTKAWLRTARTYAECETWPMNDKSCSMYGGCTFREICSKSPSVRRVFLESNFVRRTWDPLTPRTEDRDENNPGTNSGGPSLPPVPASSGS